MDKEPCLDQLRKAVAVFGVDNESEINLVRGHCRTIFYAQSEHLHEAGAIADRIFFICSGLVRFYYVTEDGREHNKSFARDNQFAGALQRSDQPEPSRFYIQAIEPTTALAISIAGLNKLFAHSLVWANLGRLYMETVAVRKAKREGEFLLDSADTQGVLHWHGRSIRVARRH